VRLDHLIRYPPAVHAVAAYPQRGVAFARTQLEFGGMPQRAQRGGRLAVQCDQFDAGGSRRLDAGFEMLSRRRGDRHRGCAAAGVAGRVVDKPVDRQRMSLDAGDALGLGHHGRFDAGQNSHGRGARRTWREPRQRDRRHHRRRPRHGHRAAQLARGAPVRKLRESVAQRRRHRTPIDDLRPRHRPAGKRRHGKTLDAHRPRSAPALAQQGKPHFPRT